MIIPILPFLFIMALFVLLILICFIQAQKIKEFESQIQQLQKVIDDLKE